MHSPPSTSPSQATAGPGNQSPSISQGPPPAPLSKSWLRAARESPSVSPASPFSPILPLGSLLGICPPSRVFVRGAFPGRPHAPLKRRVSRVSGSVCPLPLSPGRATCVHYVLLGLLLGCLFLAVAAICLMVRCESGGVHFLPTPTTVHLLANLHPHISSLSPLALTPPPFHPPSALIP